MGKARRNLEEKVEKARFIQVKRFRRLDKINCNAEMTPAMIKKFCILDEDYSKLIQLAYERI